MLIDEMVCHGCHARVLDLQCRHALCCSLGEATIGHNRVQEVIHAGCAVSDASACMEAVGLVDSRPELRPADVLTRAAIPNRIAALDVGIKSPEAGGAGEDCAEAMMQEKLQYYADVIPELERKGITYSPITFSCFGRRHGTTTKIMTQVAQRAARFRGLSSYKPLLRRWEATVSAEIWRRAAHMVRRCFPKPGPDSLMLMGEAP